ncbi:MAG: response regulator [Candidatus Omnitrophota bacterium]
MKKYKILIVDDEEVIRDSIKQLLLAEKRYIVSTASSGEEAIEKALETIPDLILLDIMMPGLSGLDVIARLKEKLDRYIPIIMLTAKGDVKSIYDAEFLGATDYIIKPFRLKELLKLVRKYADIYDV